MALRVGIIGCGVIAGAHLKGYAENGAEIRAFADVRKEAAEKFSQDYPEAPEAPEANVFTDFKDLIDSGNIDAVSICSPPVMHEEQAIYALKKGIHVLCEKPIASTVKAAKNILEAQKDSDALLMTAFRHRFLAANIKIKELIQEGRIGKLVFFNNVFCGPAFSMKDRWFSKKDISGGGSFMDTNSHSIDLFRFLAGEISEQYAVMHTHMKGIDVEDAGVLCVKSENGCIGSIMSAWVAGSSEAYIDIMGQKGRILFDYDTPSEIKVKLMDQEEWEVIPVQPGNGFKEETGHFLDAVKGECELSCSGYDGMRAVEIIQAVY